jgi:hypothetical protein
MSERVRDVPREHQTHRTAFQNYTGTTDEYRPNTHPHLRVVSERVREVLREHQTQHIISELQKTKEG